jgi:hypothetical protein
MRIQYSVHLLMEVIEIVQDVNFFVASSAHASVCNIQSNAIDRNGSSFKCTPLEIPAQHFRIMRVGC